MRSKHVKFHSLSRRIVLQFCLFTFFLATIYGLISFVLMYTLEDSLIEKIIQEEAAYLRSSYQQTGNWPQNKSANMQLYFSKDDFPADMRDSALAEPKRAEFFGQDSRHYHLYTFRDYDNVFLIAEVSENLVVRQIRNGVIQFFIIFTVPLTIIACLIAWLLGRKTTKPLSQLSNLVDGVAPDNIPDTFAERFPNNEIGILANTLEQSLRRMSDALTREKYFTRDVSHELRTPLAIIKNAIELLQNKEKSPQHTHEIILRIFQAAEQMDKTVNTLLMLAREENSLAAHESTELMPIIERSVLDNRRLLENKHIEIHIENNCSTAIMAQDGVLKVMLDNLLSNAFQYTESGEIRIAFVDGTLIVQDTGPGIAPSISHNVTQSGVKGEQSFGYGFGLSIVKRLCLSQGWQLTVDSNNGTKVSVSFNQP